MTKKHVPEADLIAALPTVAVGYYRHFKGGLYHVLNCAYDVVTLKPVVIYTRADGDNAGKLIWTRSYDDFVADVDVNGTTKKRFTFEDVSLEGESA